MTTWYEVEQAIQQWAKDDWLSGNYDADSIDEWAHETADGCEYTIYYHHANSLWLDSDYVRSFEDMVFGTEDIQERITACVYYAIQETCLLAAYEMSKESVLATDTTNRMIAVGTSEGDVFVSIPVLTTRDANPNK